MAGEMDKALLKSLKEHIIGYYMGFAAGWVGRNHGDRTQAQVDRDVCEAKGGMAGTQATLAGRAQGAAADMSVGHGAAAANVSALTRAKRSAGQGDAPRPTRRRRQTQEQEDEELG